MATSSYWNEPSTLQYDNDTIIDRMRKRTETYPDVVPFIERSLSGSKRSLTNQEFLQKVEKIAKYLVYLGVRKGDKIAIFGQNSLEWIIGEFAILFAGAVSVHINILTRDANDALEVIGICECRVLLVDPTDSDGALQLMSKFNQNDGNTHILLLRKNEKYQFNDLESEFCVPDRKSELPNLDGNDDAMMFTTSGSTGNPKLVLHTHSGMVCSIPNDKDNPSYPIFGGPSKFTIFNDRSFSWLGGSPIVNFLYGSQITFTPTSAQTKEQAMKIWDMIREEECIGGCFLPYLMQYVIDTLEKSDDDGYRLRMIFSGGQIIDDTFTNVIWRHCKLLYIGYGFTESFSGIAALPLTEGQPYCTGLAGKVNKGVELRIVDESEDLVQMGVQGEIQVRHKGLFKGYFANDKLTKEAFTPTGWFRTGDTGILSEEGILVITGRKKDIISRGTMKIIPGFIEDKINNMPGIKHVVVVGVPDDHLLEEVCACFVPVEGTDVTPAAVEDFCRNIFLKEEAADGMGEMPKYFLRFETFPSLDNGKLNKVQLKHLAAQNLQHGNK